jgi:hypothetical protein
MVYMVDIFLSEGEGGRPAAGRSEVLMQLPFNKDIRRQDF